MTRDAAQGQGRVRLAVEDGLATLVFDRPEARNAMTWTMYEQLGAHCERLAGTPGIRVGLLRGAGGEAFVAGTDIHQFLDFEGGADGVAYEARIDAGIARIEQLPFPTIAVVEGWAVGGGLAIATACDFRVATPNAKFGVPIARTLGNMLSPLNMARLRQAWGHQNVRRMLLLAQILDADDALACGFLNEVAAIDALDETVGQLVRRLRALAPVTQWASKEALRRLTVANVPAMDDLIEACYGSDDFKEGVRAFAEHRAPAWRGR